MPIYPNPEQLKALMAGPQGVPVVMVNLLRFKAQATAPDEGMTGEQAYRIYGQAMREIVESHGGRFLWMGGVDSLVIGDSGEAFDTIALVEYPSREKFAEIMQDPRVAEIQAHRAAGLESQWLIATTGAGL